jgi:hypothetical protein
MERQHLRIRTDYPFACVSHFMLQARKKGFSQKIERTIVVASTMGSWYLAQIGLYMINFTKHGNNILRSGLKECDIKVNWRAHGCYVLTTLISLIYKAHDRTVKGGLVAAAG